MWHYHNTLLDPIFETKTERREERNDIFVEVFALGQNGTRSLANDFYLFFPSIFKIMTLHRTSLSIERI